MARGAHPGLARRVTFAYYLFSEGKAGKVKRDSGQRSRAHGGLHATRSVKSGWLEAGRIVKEADVVERAYRATAQVWLVDEAR